MKAIDCANYTTVPTPAQVACLVNQGYTKAIVGCSYGTVARAQLAAFSAGGMSIEAYCWVSFTNDWIAPLDKAIATIQGTGVSRLWLDCEEDPGKTPAIDRIQQAHLYVSSRTELPLGIYTGGWWWTPNTGDSTFFSDLDFPLWSAEYVNAPAPHLYGGWSEVAIWQTRGSVDLCGLNADDNVILEEEGMTDEVKAAIAAILAHEGEQGQKLDALQASTQFLIDVVNNLVPRIEALEKKP